MRIGRDKQATDPMRYLLVLICSLPILAVSSCVMEMARPGTIPSLDVYIAGMMLMVVGGMAFMVWQAKN